VANDTNTVMYQFIGSSNMRGPNSLRARCTSLPKWLTERSCNPP